MKFPRLISALNFLRSRDLLLNVVGTVIGGIILSVLGFLYVDLIYPVPSLTGGWKLTRTIKYTADSANKGAIVFSDLQLLQQGCQITGSGNIKGQLNPGQKDTAWAPIQKMYKLDATGYLTQRLLQHASADFNIVEYGDTTSSTFTLILTVTDRNHMTGYFSNDATNSKGSIVFERDNSYWRKN